MHNSASGLGIGVRGIMLSISTLKAYLNVG